jgi:hypothetical protein
LKFTVQRDGTILDLVAAVPLSSCDSQATDDQASDDLQISCEVPEGFEASVFWFDTEARLHELSVESVHNEGYTRLIWPASGKGNVLSGKPGTEVILLCASRNGSPGQTDLEPVFADSAAWPDMPSSGLLEFDSAAVRFRVLRGPGSEDRPRPEEPVCQRAEELRNCLSEIGIELFAGVAFPHVKISRNLP